MKKALRLSAVSLLLALILPAQTLDQAEALWKARRYVDANEVFKQLVAQHPENPDYRVRWGRLFPILYRWIPQPRVLHPYPDVRFAATHPR